MAKRKRRSDDQDEEDSIHGPRTFFFKDLYPSIATQDPMYTLSSKDKFLYNSEGFHVILPNPLGVKPPYVAYKRALIPELRPYVLPGARLTRGGHISLRQPDRLSELPFTYYLAQLIHYGLDFEFSKDAARLSLARAIHTQTLKVPMPILRLEKKLKQLWDADPVDTIKVYDEYVEATQSGSDQSEIDWYDGDDADSEEEEVTDSGSEGDEEMMSIDTQGDDVTQDETPSEIGETPQTTDESEDLAQDSGVDDQSDQIDEDSDGQMAEPAHTDQHDIESSSSESAAQSDGDSVQDEEESELGSTIKVDNDEEVYESGYDENEEEGEEQQSQVSDDDMEDVKPVIHSSSGSEDEDDVEDVKTVTHSSSGSEDEDDEKEESNNVAAILHSDSSSGEEDSDDAEEDQDKGQKRGGNDVAGSDEDVGGSKAIAHSPSSSEGDPGDDSDEQAIEPVIGLDSSSDSDDLDAETALKNFLQAAPIVPKSIKDKESPVMARPRPNRPPQPLPSNPYLIPGESVRVLGSKRKYIPPKKPVTIQTRQIPESVLPRHREPSPSAQLAMMMDEAASQAPEESTEPAIIKTTQGPISQTSETPQISVNKAGPMSNSAPTERGHKIMSTKPISTAALSEPSSQRTIRSKRPPSIPAPKTTLSPPTDTSILTTAPSRPQRTFTSILPNQTASSKPKPQPSKSKFKPRSKSRPKQSHPHSLSPDPSSTRHRPFESAQISGLTVRERQKRLMALGGGGGGGGGWGAENRSDSNQRGRDGEGDDEDIWADW